jgi:hypothetical protein
MMAVLFKDLSSACRQVASIRLVITGVGDGSSVRLEAVAEGQCGMVEVRRSNVDVGYVELAFHELVIPHGGPKLVERDREVCGLHLSTQRLSQRAGKPSRCVDVPFEARNEEWLEERDPLDMVPMRMSDQKVTSKQDLAGLSLCDKLLA